MATSFSYLELLASVGQPPPDLLRLCRAEELNEQQNCEAGFIKSVDISNSIHTEKNMSISGLSDQDVGDRNISYLQEQNENIGEDSLSDISDSADEYEEDVEENYMLPFPENYTDDDDDDDPDIELLNPSTSEVDQDFAAVPTESVGSDRIPDQPIHTYRIRKRTGRSDKPSNCRESRTMGSIEIAMRTAASRKPMPIFQPIVGTVFDSATEAYEFYNLYSWEKGFGISYGKSDTNRGNGYRTMQELTCANEGFDKRCINQSQRNECKAVVRLLRTEDHGWYISKFVEGHNHLFSESCGEKMQWRSHRRIDESAKNMIKYLRDNNVPLGKVHSIMGSIYGSVKELPFTKRSLRTLCQQLAREQMDDDVKKTLAIFRKMRKEDTDFPYSVDVPLMNLGRV